MNTFIKFSQHVRDLRSAARREVTTSSAVSKPVDTLQFDMSHTRTRSNDLTAEDFDAENGVARYVGGSCPHIGNGAGGPR